MRAIVGVGVVVIVGACHSSAPPAAPPVSSAAPAATTATAAEPPAAAPSAPAAKAETVAGDTPRTTVEGNRFMAPAGWSITVRGAATILAPPEEGNWIALVDVRAADADAALKAGWAAYKPDARWPLKVSRTAPDREGWTNVHTYEYQTSPNERRDVEADVRNAGGDRWLVAIYDMQQQVGEKRIGQIVTVFDRLQPKGFERESFAGKTANKLDKARVAELGKFIEAAQERLGVPGVALGLVQDGKVVFSGGFGTRTLGARAPVDGNTLFMIASNTKAMTTLMLGKLVDEHKLAWDTQVTTLLPSFKLGSADTTSRVLVKHLICACTGMPRQDLEWLLQFKGVTPSDAMASLATFEPTSKFGELFQYSNSMAAAAGFVGGHVAFPKLELGAAYDEAMRTRVFEPLGMKSTTFDFRRALRGNHAQPYAPDIDGKPARAVMEINYAVIPLRPAGAAWSNVNDVLRYVQMELDNGMVGGKRYIEKDTLLARRAPQIAIGKDVTYGMGLEVDTTYGIPVVHHGGSMIGYKTDMMWLPEHNVGAVVLTNSDRGGLLHSAFRRKLLEVLFDGKHEAEEDVASADKAFHERRAATRKLLTVPADPAEAGKLAAHYANDALGEIAVRKAGGATIFDMGEWQSEVASQRNPDGTISFVTIRPGIFGFELVVGASGGKRTLIARDGQHEYVFAEN
jgi:CubicO group peptidase (beta-lactamase class C family)